MLSCPDILLFKSRDDIQSLVQLQLAILQTACKYVKIGGTLAYSTCSLFKKENEEVIAEFLRQNSEFEIEAVKLNVGEKNELGIRLFPNDDGVDGFFICKLTKTKNIVQGA